MNIVKAFSELPSVINLFGFSFRLKFKRHNQTLTIGYFLDGVISKSRKKREMFKNGYWYDKRAEKPFPTKIYTSWLMCYYFYDETDSELLEALTDFRKHIFDLLMIEQSIINQQTKQPNNGKRIELSK